MLYVATMTTLDLHIFQSVAASADAAKKAIQRGWVAHLVQLTRQDADLYDDVWFDRRFKTLPQLEKAYTILVTPLVMNDCAMDGATLLVH